MHDIFLDGDGLQFGYLNDLLIGFAWRFGLLLRPSGLGHGVE